MLTGFYFVMLTLATAAEVRVLKQCEEAERVIVEHSVRGEYAKGDLAWR